MYSGPTCAYNTVANWRQTGEGKAAHLGTWEHTGLPNSAASTIMMATMMTILSTMNTYNDDLTRTPLPSSSLSLENRTVRTPVDGEGLRLPGKRGAERN